MIVGARRADLSIPKNADLLGFSRTTISREWSEKEKISSESRFLLRHSGSKFGVKNKKAWVILPRLNGSGCWWWCNYGGIFSWHTLGPLVPIEHCLNTTVFLSIVADHLHPFMTTVYPSSDEYFQQDNAACHKAQIISDWFLEHDNEFTLLQMASTVTRSQSNRAPLGCGGMGDSHHGCAADKSAATVWCYHVNIQYHSAQKEK